MFSLGFLQYCRVNLSLRILNLPSWQFSNWIMQNRSWTFQFNYSEDQIQTTDSNNKKKKVWNTRLWMLLFGLESSVLNNLTQKTLYSPCLCVKVTGKLPEAVARRRSVKSVLRNFTTFTGKHVCQSHFAGISLWLLPNNNMFLTWSWHETIFSAGDWHHYA